jgi:hypothetical protein
MIGHSGHSGGWDNRPQSDRLWRSTGKAAPITGMYSIHRGVGTDQQNISFTVAGPAPGPHSTLSRLPIPLGSGLCGVYRTRLKL